MDARRRSTYILLTIAILAFAIRWPLDNYICNPKTWPYRPPAKEGQQLMKSVFSGGAGTPAVYAMLGGQRYLVANILWTYSDVLFHQGHPEKMPGPLESTVTMNPSFLEAWSVYGWHMAWNMNTYTPNLVLKEKYLLDGEEIFKRALLANPDKPLPYFDLSWLYIQREGQYDKAVSYLEAVVNNSGYVIMNDENGKPVRIDIVKKRGKGGRPEAIRHDQLLADGTLDQYEPVIFQPYTQQDIRNFTSGTVTDSDALVRKWLPSKYGNRLAFVYRKMAIITATDKDGKLTNDPALLAQSRAYLQKSIDTYTRMFQKVDPGKPGEVTAAETNAKELTRHLDDTKWLKEQIAEEMKHRDTYGMQMH